jgi:hypothetical protein
MNKYKIMFLILKIGPNSKVDSYPPKWVLTQHQSLPIIEHEAKVIMNLIFKSWGVRAGGFFPLTF